MITYEFVNYTEIGTLINFRALGVIFGMMIVVEVVKDSGIFQFFGIKAIKLARGDPKSLFVIMIIFTAILSAFLSNQVSILIIAALTFTLCRSLEINPTPFIIAESVAANIGGITFLTSSSPSIIAGGAAGISFSQFVAFSLPFAILLLIATVIMFLLIYRGEFNNYQQREFGGLDEWSVVKDKSFFYKSLAILVFTIIFFLLSDSLGVTPDFVAISSAIVILLLSGADPDKTLKDVQWGTIFFFVGLFIVVGGLEKSGFLSLMASRLIYVIGDNQILSIPLVLSISFFTSGIVNNIPITITLIPIVESLVATFNISILWWSLMFGVGLGGNLTPLGSPSNVIAMNIAKKEGNPISFSEFMRVGFIVTMVQLILAMGYLLFRFMVF
jgi:Na+/H+ antiporter NhaD/arsenite permease-like protein